MTSRPAIARLQPRSRVSPLVLAILAAFPAVQAATVARPPAPLANAVPKPAVGWVVSTSTPNAPSTLINSLPNAAGGVNQTINQASQSAVYNWTSFDIGAASSVTFNYPSANGSSLNRVTGSLAPSAIYGILRSQYANPDPKNPTPLVGGSIYLVNANGILFGKTAQVDTGALIASTLDLQNADFHAGLSQSINSTGYTFGPFASVNGTPAGLLPGADNFVLVDPGARIATASGGRVFLFANNVVQNAGTITTPNGQTALAAGDQVYLNLPTNEVMYASEVNPQIPAVNGLLVEVGSGNGSVANLQGGIINTPTGNTTLVGMAVNQSGRINATTSVSQNGSVLLLARYGAQGALGGGVIVKEATQTGTLTLGPAVTVNGVANGVIDIEPDATRDAKGHVATSNANSAFTSSRVELEGHTIELQSGASIIAHGGVVDVRAETTPYYVQNGVGAADYNYAGFNGDSARLVMAANATIDVSGTTDTPVSAGRNFVTTALLGASDLADAPLQRTGPVYRSELTFDVRSAVPILGDTSAYTKAIQKTADERLSAGGSIKLSSTGAVVTSAASALDVSGGAVNYTAAQVSPSQLLGSDGKVYSFNQAPAGLAYTAVLGAGSGTLDRWGVVPAYAPSQVSTGFVTPGYTAGQAGGSLSVVSALAVLDGHIAAGVTQGARQTAGLDSLTTASRLTLGARTNGNNAFGSGGFTSAGLGNVDIVATPGMLSGDFWAAPLDAALPDTSRIAASTLNASGLGQIRITVNDGIATRAGANLVLPSASVVDLAAGGAAGIDLGADIRSAGGTVSATTRSFDSQGAVGSVVLDAGRTLDVSANWVNRAIDGATAMAATAGGSVTLSSGAALDLQDASTIDVSGGATVGTAGKVAGTAAGSVTLQSNLVRGSDFDAASAVHIGSHLLANSLTTGGTLTLSADSIAIQPGALPGGVADGAAVGSLVLSNQFFQQGAFSNYVVDALSSLVVGAGTTLQPQAVNWIATPAAATLPTGTRPASFMGLGTLPDAQRQPVSLTLSAASALGKAYGQLALASGASIVADPRASVTLDAGLALDVGGRIVAPSGNVTLGLVGSAQSNNPAAGTLTLGPRSVVDVSGTVLLQPQTGALPTGQVLAGGHVALSISPNAALTPIVIAPGALIDADGTSAVLGVTITSAAGSTSVVAQSVASAGGSISIAANHGGVLAGSLHALGGDANVSGGAFNLSGAPVVVVQQASVTASAPVAGVVAVSAQDLGRNFSDVSLQSGGEIHFDGSSTLAMAGNLALDAPVLTATPGHASVVLSGASTLVVGAGVQQLPSARGAFGGDATLSLSGGLVELFGQQALQGFGQVGIAAASELRLQSVTGGPSPQGSLAVQGALTLSAPLIVPTTASAYTFDAPGQQVLITGGDTHAVTPLSAGGSVTVNAATITTVDPDNAAAVGVVRAPFGSIVLNATDGVTIGAGSLLSVSGDGMTVPFGQTNGGANWSYGGVPLAAPPVKSISLNAPTGAIDVAAGATLDLSGGGNLVAQEFVPGVGGSKNIFAGAANGAFAVVPTASLYAPQDLDVLQYQRDASSQAASLQLGRDITFGAGGPIPAGTYAILPAQYATLAGAFLVTPAASSAPLALGASVRQTDGSVLVGGRVAEAGTGFGASLTQSYKVQTSTQALAYSEIDQANANTYFGAQAGAAGHAAPALPTDAGTLAIAANQLQLQGSTLFKLPTTTTGAGASATTKTTGRGGELDISAADIQVGGTAASGVLALDAAELDATGAATIVLGGHLDAASGKLDVAAHSVVIDNVGSALTLNDLVLVATDAVTLMPGAVITAPAAPTTGAAVAAPALTLSGDGALLRVSSDSAATSVRTGAQGDAGALSIGAGVKLAGGAITAEGTLTNAIAGDATLDAKAITLGAGRMAVGDVPVGGTTPDTLLLSSALAAQVAGAQSLTLRSANGLDLYGAATLGGDGVKSLTIDTGAINLIGDGQTAVVEAGAVTLTNSTGQAGTAAGGTNTLAITALDTTVAAGSGLVTLGAGTVAVTGAREVAVSATHEVVLADAADLHTGGDLAVAGAALQATREARASLDVGGTFTLTAAGTASGLAAGRGAQVHIDAQAVAQQGTLVLPSGQLDIAASNANGAATAVRFGAGSVTDLSGNSTQIDKITIATPGGTLSVATPAGNVVIATGATVDVSAPATGAQAGSIALSAPAGSVVVQGSLRGTAAAGQGGGSLSIDSAAPLDLAALAATIAAQANNFGGSLSVRNRTGDQQLAAGTRLVAQDITLSADSGTLDVAGTLVATGSGARVTLAGGAGLDIEAGAAIGAHATGTTGAEVQLLGGARQLQADGTFGANAARVDFNGGTIDTSGSPGSPGGANGTLVVRALRGTDGTGVAVGGSGGTTVTGVSRIEIESVKQYATSLVDGTLISQVSADNATLGASTAPTLARVGALLGTPASALQLRSGVEVDSTGDLTMAGDPHSGGWNLTSFTPNGVAQAQPTGAPMNLTLRARGNLVIAGSISDGFLPSGTVPATAGAASVIKPAAVIAQSGGSYFQGADIALVGGADLAAANVMATTASTTQGDVAIGASGANVLVRSTTGDIRIAAGRDVTLLNAQADVYTTGTPVVTPAGYVGNLLTNAAYLRSGTTSQSPLLGGGGSLDVHAGRDIVGAPDTSQYATEWAWRALDQRNGGQPMWWNRYDQFQQGFATFGGGNVAASAVRDVVNADFSAAASGYVARNADGSVGAPVQFGGGDLAVRAGRDVLGGFVLAAGRSGTVFAGRDIAAGDSSYALQVLYGDTALDIAALDNVHVGIVSSFGLVPATRQYLGTPLDWYIQGLAPHATLRMQAAAGNLAYDASSPLDGADTRTPGASTVADRVVPDAVTFTAPEGDISAGRLIQDPAGPTQLTLLARGNLSLAGVTVNGTDAHSAMPTVLVDGAASVLDPLNNNSPGLTPLDTGTRSPMELVAQTGDVTIHDGILTTTSLRLLAGHDILMVQPIGDVFRGITLQTQGVGELALIQAGRDIVFADTGQAYGGVSLYGPGSLLMVAGRDIDLSTSGGVRAVGNRQNAALPAASGNVTVAAGVSLDTGVTLAGGDYAQATAWYFPALGGTGIAGFAPDLVAQLGALKAGQTLPAPGSGAATQYAARPIADQVVQVKALVDPALFDAEVLADAQRRAGTAAVTLAQAQDGFAKLDASQQSRVLGAALADAWVAGVPAAQQQQQVLAFAQTQKNAALDTLQQFVVAQGIAAATGAQALAAFEAMAPERQALLTNQVLVGVLRQSGRAASALSGAAQTAAYEPAYAALDTVFPGSAGAGRISLGASQVETLQDSNITVLAPRGSVDVGTLVAGTNPKQASALGIVTADGGDIAMVVGDSVNVDQSRVFTVGLGDLLMWASNGSLDAGRGGKTVVGAPAPVYYLNAQGQFVIDTSGSFSGSGIAVLNAASSLDLYAPKGEINAGDAGIKSLGNAYFGAVSFVGADNLSVGGLAVGAPPPASTGGGTAGLAAVGQSAAAVTQVNAGDSEEEKERKRRKRLNLVLDFLGFGDGTAKP